MKYSNTESSHLILAALVAATSCVRAIGRLRRKKRNVTVVGANDKVYTTIKAPATLDEMLDLVSERFDLRMAVADVLYSSPYDSFADQESQGGTPCSSNLRPTRSLPPSVT